MPPGSQLGVTETEFHPELGNSMKGKKLSVCQVVSGDRYASAEAQLAALPRGLIRNEELLLSVAMLNEGRLAKEARSYSIEVKVIPESHCSLLQIFSEATRYLRSRDVRILYSHRYKENLLAALLAWRCKVPLVVRTQHVSQSHSGRLNRYKQWAVHLLDGFVARYATDARGGTARFCVPGTACS